MLSPVQVFPQPFAPSKSTMGAAASAWRIDVSEAREM